MRTDSGSLLLLDAPCRSRKLQHGLAVAQLKSGAQERGFASATGVDWCGCDQVVAKTSSGGNARAIARVAARGMWCATIALLLNAVTLPAVPQSKQTVRVLAFLASAEDAVPTVAAVVFDASLMKGP